MSIWITGKLSCYTTLKQFPTNNIILSTIVILLQHDTICDALKELFSKKWFWFRLWHRLHVASRSDAFELSTTCELLGNVVAATRFHVVD